MLWGGLPVLGSLKDGRSGEGGIRHCSSSQCFLLSMKCDANSKSDLLVKGGGGKQSLVIAADEDISLAL